MAQRKSLLWTEVRVGVLVLTSFLLLVIAIFLIGGESGFLTEKYSIIAYFPSADGIKAGAEVRFEGVTIGNVGCRGWFAWRCRPVRIFRGGDKLRSVEVELQIDRRFQSEILTDSEITMDTVGLLGDKTIEITRGEGKGQPVPDKGSIQGREVPGISQVVRNANDVMANFEIMSRTISKITDRIDKGEGTAGQFLTNDSIYRNIDKTIKDTNQAVDRISSKVTALIDDAHTGRGAVARFINDDTIYTNLNNSVTQLTQRVDNLIERAERGDGSVAKFLNDPALYNNANRLIDNMNATVANANRMVDSTHVVVNNVNKMVDSTHVVVNNANRMIDTTQVAIQNADRFITDARGMIAHVENGEGTIGKLYKDDGFYTDLRGSVAKFTQLMDTIENGDGTAGKFIKDPSVYNGVKDTTAEIQKLIYDFRQDPKRFMTITFKLF
jgi:phospholipid/cholesterol/gamma-HCH transport system substrate-binding protein